MEGLMGMNLDGVLQHYTNKRILVTGGAAA